MSFACRTNISMIVLSMTILCDRYSLTLMGPKEYRFEYYDAWREETISQTMILQYFVWSTLQLDRFLKQLENMIFQCVSSCIATSSPHVRREWKWSRYHDPRSAFCVSVSSNIHNSSILLPRNNCIMHTSRSTDWWIVMWVDLDGEWTDIVSSVLKLRWYPS